MSLHTILFFMGNVSTVLDVWKPSPHPAMNFSLAFPFEWISTSDMEIFPFFFINKALMNRIQENSDLQITHGNIASILNIRSNMKLSRSI